MFWQISPTLDQFWDGNTTDLVFSAKTLAETQRDRQVPCSIIDRLHYLLKILQLFSATNFNAFYLSQTNKL